jgi:hypothetical protein
MPRQTSPQEIADLLAIVDRDLHNSQVDDLSPDWQLNIAYNAALQAAKAALAAHVADTTEYDQAGISSAADADEMRTLATTIRGAFWHAGSTIERWSMGPFGWTVCLPSSLRRPP